jgi:hypothetical protein
VLALPELLALLFTPDFALELFLHFALLIGDLGTFIQNHRNFTEMFLVFLQEPLFVYLKFKVGLLIQKLLSFAGISRFLRTRLPHL